MASSNKVASKASKTKEVNYKELAKAELTKIVAELKEELVILKKGTIMGDVQNVRAYKFKRRELARVLTALNGKGQEEIK